MSDLFEQFFVRTIYPLKLFGIDISITNSSLMMIVVSLLIMGCMIFLCYFWRKNRNWLEQVPQDTSSETIQDPENYLVTEFASKKTFYICIIGAYFCLMFLFYVLSIRQDITEACLRQLFFVWVDIGLAVAMIPVLYSLSRSAFPLMLTYGYFFIRTLVQPLHADKKNQYTDGHNPIHTHSQDHHATDSMVADHHPAHRPQSLSYTQVSIVLTVFFMILFGNILGLVPYCFTFTSQIINTAILATFVIVSTVLMGLYHHGLGFLSLFVIRGLPLPIQFIVVPLEVTSFVLRNFSLSMRLFANMMVGHCILKICAGFSEMMGMFGFVPIPFTMILMMMELGVAFIQAYVFALLSAQYTQESIDLH